MNNQLAALIADSGRDPDHPAQELGFREADFRGTHWED